MDALERVERSFRSCSIAVDPEDVRSVCGELRTARKWVKENWNDDVSGRIAQSLAEKMKEARGE